MYVIPSLDCMSYHAIVMPGIGTILNGIIVAVIVCLSTLQSAQRNMHAADVKLMATLHNYIASYTHTCNYVCIN